MRANNQKVYMPREGKLISDINKVGAAPKPFTCRSEPVPPLAQQNADSICFVSCEPELHTAFAAVQPNPSRAVVQLLASGARSRFVFPK